MRPTIYAWKRERIPVNPSSMQEIDTDNAFCKMDSGESIVKGDVNVNDDPNRRVLVMSTDKIIRELAAKARSGVMDGTFKVKSTLSSKPYPCTT